MITVNLYYRGENGLCYNLISEDFFWKGMTYHGR